MKKKTFNLRWLLLGEFFGSFGNSFIWPLTTIYMHNQLQQSLTMSGIVLMLYSLANVIGSYISGILFDRYNPQKLMLAGLSGAIIIMGILTLYNTWPAYPILLTIFGFFNGWIITLLNTYGTQVSNQKSRFVFNMIYFTNNLGMVFGTMIAGPVYQMTGNHVSLLFVITIIMYILYGFVVQYYFKLNNKVQLNKKATKRILSDALPLSNKMIIWILFVSIAIIWITYSQWSTNLSVYMTNRGISMTKYSLLWTLNGIFIIVFQTIINWLTNRITNDYWFIYFGILACSSSFIILIMAHTYPMFILGMAVLTLGEATAFPTIPTIINALTPDSVKGKYQGLLNACISIGKSIGPLIGSLLIQISSYQGLFIFCSIILITVTLIILGVKSFENQNIQSY